MAATSIETFTLENVTYTLREVGNELQYLKRVGLVGVYITAGEFYDAKQEMEMQRFNAARVLGLCR